ncbi:MAG: TetR/AcrR family transcriptional regulator [Pseudomonadota bacterium]|nr:TetR/AcrR family transcriptional regulator [Pseudomonadota bacterium]
MEKQSLARGLETRIANKHKRRNHIVACAGKIIAEDGLEAFTIARLAEQADVTIPTVHNLLGKRADILDTLVDETMSEVMAAATGFDPSDTIAAVEDFINGLTSLLATNESLYRAAFIAGEWTNYFEHRSTTGIVAQARNQARLICQNAVAQGKLEGALTKNRSRQDFFHRNDWRALTGCTDILIWRLIAYRC